jgi:hypothetical protein
MVRLMPQDSTSAVRPPTRTCDVCGGPTRERKPYCTECVVQHASYPKALTAILSDVEKELEDVRRRGEKAVRLNGLVVEEILEGIRNNGRLTWRRLIKDHVAFLNSAPMSVSYAYLTKLQASGLVDVTQTRRGGEIVTLTKKAFALLR